MLDCGLCSASLGLTMQQLQLVTELTIINKGGMGEQMVGQQLRTITSPFISPLYIIGNEKKRVLMLK